MSYIRPNSNPEAMYVVGSTDGTVTLHGGLPISTKGGSAPMTMPRHVFEDVARRWIAEWPDRISHRGFVVAERYVFLETGAAVPEDESLKTMMTDRRARAFLIRLTYRKVEIYMWRVTWHYICHNVEGRKKVGKGSKKISEKVDRKISPKTARKK